LHGIAQQNLISPKAGASVLDNLDLKEDELARRVALVRGWRAGAVMAENLWAVGATYAQC
jgi:hypothetical protein